MSRVFSEFSWLNKLSSPIQAAGRNVEVLYTPDQYYNALKHGIHAAKQRVVLSSLYLGTGSKEAELVNALKDTLADGSRPDFRCTMLLDHLRGSRGHPSSRTMLQDLVYRYGEKFQFYLYHTPNLRGFLRQIVPERFNEVMGLQHMKIYIFDNDLLISGANLSRDYFTDRQDRYVKFKNCPQLADFFAKLVHTVTTYSFQLQPDGSTEKPTAVHMDPLSSTRAAMAFRTAFGSEARELTQPDCSSQFESSPVIEGSEVSREGFDTVVYPLVQMGYYGIRQDELVTQEILGRLKADEQLYLASGYFNLPPQYIEAILKGKGECSVLAASPQACGFYGAKGIAGHVPCMYMHFARKFLEAVSMHKCKERVKYLEFFRKGWTFHGKGLWHYLTGEELPSLTLFGSSNYGHRSLMRDLEAQVAIVTTNTKLRENLHEEQRRMFGYGRELGLAEAVSAPERKLNLWQWIATQMFKTYV